MIWFYPLNELDFTGYEAFFGVLLIPIVCSWQLVLNAVRSQWGICILRLVTLVGVASFQAPTTFSRLVILSIGASSAVLVLLGTLWNNCAYQRWLSFWGLILGFYAVLVSRIWYVTILPTWADALSNQVVLAIGTLATVDRLFTKIDDSKTRNSVKSTLTSSCNYCWILSAISFGSLLYATATLFSEVSVLSRWVVSGHPHSGPDPNPWGGLVLVALAVGTILSTYQSPLLTSKIWWTVGTAGIMSLYLLPTYRGFIGGVALAVYVMSVWPEVVKRVTTCPPAKTLTLAMVTFMAEVLYSIWTVAYNFVPGGEYTREHTGYLLGFMSLTWLFGITFGGNKTTTESTTKGSKNEPQIPVAKLNFVLFLLLSLGLGGFIYRFPPAKYQHTLHKADGIEFSALIWTYHFGYDNNGWPSLERSAWVLNETGADMITLLESDASKPFLGNNDLTTWLGERLGLYADFGPSTRDHTWGNMILSKHPIVKSQHHLLPSPRGELAPAISATLNISGVLVDFVTTHMGNDRDTLDRKLQAEYLANLLDNSKNPVVFLGYVTSKPGSRDYNQLTKGGRMKDIDKTDRDRWCEYIMYRGLIRLGYARISHGGLSDTELQMAKFRIPPKDSSGFDHDVVEIDPSQVPEEQRFTDSFGGYKSGHHWAWTHQYHSSTPKYFLKQTSD